MRRRTATLLALPLLALVAPSAHAIPPAYGVTADCEVTPVAAELEHVTVVAHAIAKAGPRPGVVATRVHCTVSDGTQTLELSAALPGHAAADADTATFSGFGWEVCYSAQAWWVDGEMLEVEETCEFQ